MLRVIKLSLDRNGFDVDTALSGDTALAMLKTASDTRTPNNFPYDVVIVSADMPGMNGKELCESTHRDFADDAPLMFIVGDDKDKSLSEWAIPYRATEVLEKPMSLRWLVSRLNDHFGRYDKQAAVAR